MAGKNKLTKLNIMVIGYDKRFPDKIIEETKKHTIRVDQYDRWHAGMKMHQSTGVRTKNYKCFKRDTCTGTQTIKITYHQEYASVSIDHYCFANYDTNGGTCFNLSGLRELATNDGFESVKAFFDWFNKDFTGKIIHWTDLRY